MPETSTPVSTVQIDYTCDECGKGNMRSDGMTLTSWPPQYPHNCDKCGAGKMFRNVKYPHIAYVTPGATMSEKAAGELADEIERRRAIPDPEGVHQFAYWLVDNADRIIAALRTPSGARDGGEDGWQPIATAPKLYERVLLLDQFGVPVIGSYMAHGTYSAEARYPVLGQCHPTHWQPLPAPPVTASESAREEG